MWLKQGLVHILGPFDSFCSGPLNRTVAHSEGTVMSAIIPQMSTQH